MIGAVRLPRAPDATYGARAMWLRLYAEGGRWSRADLLDAFGADAAMDVDLWQMEQARQVRRWGQGQAAAYGVTRACLVPPWLTIGELEAPALALAAVVVPEFQATPLSPAEMVIAADLETRGMAA